MRKLTNLTTLITLLAAFACVGCAKDSNYDSDINKLNERMNTLESLMADLNSDVFNLQSVVTALNAGDYITSVTELSGGRGYTIKFAKQSPITIYNGDGSGLTGTDTPTMGIAMFEDGKYYWTLTVDGKTSWFKSIDGKMLLAAIAAPVFGIDTDNCWTIDGQPIKDAAGNKVSAVGKDGANGTNGTSGTPFFNNVTVVSGNVLFELANGTVITIPFSPYTIAFQGGTDVLVFPESREAITFTVLLSESLTKSTFAAFSAEVKGKAGGDIDVVTRSATSGWKVSVVAPVFNAQGILTTNPRITITPPTGLLTGSEPSAILTLTLVSSSGQITTVSRAMRVGGSSVAIIRGGTRLEGIGSLKDALSQAVSGDIIELAEGRYPLTVDPALAAGGNDWYLRVATENITIRGVGNVVVYGETVTPSGVIATESLIYVAASGFRLENVTVMPKPGTQINRLIEVTAGGSLLFKNCTFAPNSIVAGAPQNDAGSVALNPGKTATGSFRIENCTFSYCQLQLSDCPAGVSVTAQDCTFSGQPVSTLYSRSSIVSGSADYITAPESATLAIQGCTFTNVAATPDNDGTNAAIRASLGEFRMSGNRFPTNGCYWAVYRDAFVSIVPATEWQVGSFWITDRSEPVGWTSGGGELSFRNATPTSGEDYYKYYGKLSNVGMSAAGYWKVSAELYINPADVAVKMRKSIWVYVQDTDRTPVDWAILEYSTEGASPVWRVFDAFNNTGWSEVAQANYGTGDFHRLIIEYAGDKVMKFYVDGVQVHTYTNPELTTSQTSVRSVILQSYDTGETYTSRWKTPVVSGS